MKRLLFVLCLVATPLTATPAPYDVTKLADGVYGFMWREPSSPEPNVLIIVNDADVVVVDSSLFPSTSRLVAAEIRKLTPHPVRYVVNTHWHDDHVFGNSVYRELWPGVELIAHPHTRTDAEKQGFGKIPKDLEDNLATLERYRTVLATGKKSDGSTLDDATRARVVDLIALLERYAAEMPNVRMLLPDLLIEHELILRRGARTIEIRHLGRGNTRGDLIVHLPKEKIVATGDLVVAPTPYGFGSYYAEWATTLEKVTALQPSILFLAHGGVHRDFTYVTKLRRLLNDLVSRVAAEVARGATLEEVQKTVTLADWKKELAGDDPLLQRTFDGYFVTPAVERAYRQAKGEPDNQEVVVR